MATMTKEKQYEYLADDPKAKIVPILVALILGDFFAMLNETLLNIAIVTLMDYFQIAINVAQWSVTGFMLVMGVVTPISAVLLSWYSTRSLFLFSAVTFTIGTIICAAAPFFSVLMFGRVLQAIGAAILLSILFTAFLYIFPPERRGKMLGLIGLVYMFAPAIGPTLSGVIVQYLGWRYLFIVAIPFMLISILLGYKYIVNVTEVTKPKVDILSLVYSSLGFGGIVYGFSAAGQEGNNFGTGAVLIPIMIGVIALILFSFRQFTLDNPIIDLRVFTYPMFTHAILMFAILDIIMLSSEVIMPIYMQQALLFAPAIVGLALLPGSLLSGALSPIMGSVFDRHGPRVLMIPATILLVLAMFLMYNFNIDTSMIRIICAYVFLMTAVAAIMMPAETNGLNQLPKRLYPHGTALIVTLQPVFGAVGVAVFVSMMNSRQQSILQQVDGQPTELAIREALVSGVELVYFVALIMAIIGFILSLFVYRSTPGDMKK